MAQTLAEYEATFIQNLKTDTGKDFREWLAILGTCGLTDRNEIKKWLQKNYGLDYMPSHKLAFLYLEDVELNGPKVKFRATGRGGDVIYESKETTFTMWYDIGGGDALAVIDVPTPAQWESLTRTPLARRMAILDFIGKKVVEVQTYGEGSFKILENSIVVYSFKKT